MCGITGFWSAGSRHRPTETIRAMTDRLQHRGPDGQGVWLDEQAGIALGHRRLSIIDLSEGGAQPMTSASGRYVVTYNGELYNFSPLRKAIARRAGAYPFRGSSDTEVLLAAIDIFGLDEALRRSNGMFAFALWDRSRRQLTLARDRLGIKPLYYGWTKSALCFGSELAAIRRYPDFKEYIDRQALADLLRLNSIPAPRSIYRDVRKLEPGTTVSFRSPDDRGSSQRFWSAHQVARRGLETPFEGSAGEAVDALETLLLEAVEDRMVADVPLGAFLSGGVDSSTVVALMQEISRRPVKTFSIGFYEEEYNEATDAARVAAHLGTDHHEQYISYDDAHSVIASLPTLYDEPFADSSQIPTYLVSRLARRNVTVSLSGDGGDELFAGYNRHLWAPRIWRAISPVPRLLRMLVATAMLLPGPSRVDASYRRIEPLLPDGARVRIPAEKLQKLGECIGAGHLDQIYDRLRADWPDPTRLVIGVPRDKPLRREAPEGAGAAEQMMFRDLVSYLPDDILTKVDRASMAVGLEARVPLLDHRVVDFAWRLPMALKIRNGSSKWILRQILYRRVPKQLIERPKMGFGIPIDHWLRGPLRDWAEPLLDSTRLRREGFFRPEPVRRIWREHLEERANHQHRLWNILTFQAWLADH